tara:strand:+ start:419 stop:784 length:366 start_codon:yes stop_codon:yes gene_type:complete
MSTKISTPTHKDLEVVKNDFSKRQYAIKIAIPEFNCVCPRTGLPDFGTIHIEYVPRDGIVELKSLKLYIVKYRNVGIFHENVTNKILDDFKRACNPHKISVVGDFHPRGGIKTEVLAEDNM